MPRIIWDQSYSVGVDLLDQQHKKLIGMINELAFAMRNDRGREVVKDIVDDMVSYMQKHFADEEKYLHDAKYLGLLQHLKEHEEFVRYTKDFEQRCQAGDYVLSLEVLNFLADWLKRHILESDRKYAPVLREQGLR